MNTPTLGVRTAVRVLIGLGALGMAVALAIGGLFLWALTATDTSLLARGLVWGDRTTEDWKRLPSRSAVLT